MSKLLANLLATLALKFFDKAREGPEHVKGKEPGKLEKKLRDKLKKQLSISIVLLFFLIGCAANKIVYVPDGKAVRLRETIKNADVWAQDESGKWVPGKIEEIHEGWY